MNIWFQFCLQFFLVILNCMFKKNKENFSIEMREQGLISPTCLHLTFVPTDHKSSQRQSSHQCLFPLMSFACKMLVKLTTGVNFINIKLTNFKYESLFFYLHFGFAWIFVQKMCAQNVDEINDRAQFHQHSMSRFTHADPEFAKK